MSQPIGKLEYELSDDLAIAMASSWFAWKTRQVKEETVRQGSPHPALPIVLVSVMLVIGMVLTVAWVWDSLLTQVLFVVSFFVLLLLLFKGALYFCPPFARWYIRWQTMRGLRKLKPRTITWTFFDDRIETQSAAVQRKVAWTDLQQLQLLPDVWVLTLKSGVPLMLPVSVTPTDLLQLIGRKAEEAGVVIAGDRGASA